MITWPTTLLGPLIEIGLDAIEFKWAVWLAITVELTLALRLMTVWRGAMDDLYGEPLDWTKSCFVSIILLLLEVVVSTLRGIVGVGTLDVDTSGSTNGAINLSVLTGDDKLSGWVDRGGIGGGWVDIVSISKRDGGSTVVDWAVSAGLDSFSFLFEADTVVCSDEVSFDILIDLAVSIIIIRKD